MLGYIAEVRRTGRHDVDVFKYAITIEEGGSVAFSETGETRSRAIFVDCYATPTKFAFSTLYDPSEVERWVGRVSYKRLAWLNCESQKERG